MLIAHFIKEINQWDSEHFRNIVTYLFCKGHALFVLRMSKGPYCFFTLRVVLQSSFKHMFPLRSIGEIAQKLQL